MSAKTRASYSWLEIVVWIFSIIISLEAVLRTFLSQWLRSEKLDATMIMSQGVLLIFATTLAVTSYANAMVRLVQVRAVVTLVCGSALTFLLLLLVNHTYVSLRTLPSLDADRLTTFTLVAAAVGCAISFALKVRLIRIGK